MSEIKKRNKCFIYKNDLKFSSKFDLEQSEFGSDAIQSIYKNFKDKPKIELRIEDSKIENYNYLDLSRLEIDNEHLMKLFELKKIDYILSRIDFLDLSNNKLTQMPDLSKYSNIKYLSVSFNQIDGDIIDNNLIELSCHNNTIRSISSNKITHLSASNNKITQIDVPKVKILHVNFNKINWIPSLINLKYLECIGNHIQKIDNMLELEELYIGSNNLVSITNMPKLKILNCVNNPIKKIKYFPTLNTLMTSVANISSQYNLSGMEKCKSDYIINFIPFSN